MGSFTDCVRMPMHACYTCASRRGSMKWLPCAIKAGRLADVLEMQIDIELVAQADHMPAAMSQNLNQACCMKNHRRLYCYRSFY